MNVVTKHQNLEKKHLQLSIQTKGINRQRRHKNDEDDKHLYTEY